MSHDESRKTDSGKTRRLSNFRDLLKIHRHDVERRQERRWMRYGAIGVGIAVLNHWRDEIAKLIIGFR